MVVFLLPGSIPDLFSHFTIRMDPAKWYGGSTTLFFYLSILLNYTIGCGSEVGNNAEPVFACLFIFRSCKPYKQKTYIGRSRCNLMGFILSLEILYINKKVSIYLFIYLYVYISICHLYVYLSIFLCICVSFYLCIYLSLYPSIYLCIFLYVYRRDFFLRKNSAFARQIFTTFLIETKKDVNHFIAKIKKK